MREERREEAAGGTAEEAAASEEGAALGISMDRRAEYLQKLQKAMKKNYLGFERKHIVDYTRRKYSELWLRQGRDLVERITSSHIFPVEKRIGGIAKDVFLINPRASQMSKPGQ